jgi:hypothetical protein
MAERHGIEQQISSGISPSPAAATLARRCFRSAMEQANGKALHAMQNLSMLLRQKRGSPEERHAYVQESLTLAKDVSGDARISKYPSSKKSVRQTLTLDPCWPSRATPSFRP